MNLQGNRLPTAPTITPLSITQHKNNIKKTSSIIGVLLIMVTAISVVIGLSISFFVGPDAKIYNNSLAESQLYSIIVYSFMFIIPIFVGIKALGISSSVLFPLRKPKSDVLWGSIGISMGVFQIASLLVAFTAEFFATTFGHVPIDPSEAAPRGLLANLLFFVSVAILPAFLEEFLFRGVIMQSLRRYGDGFALLISSVLFGFAHGNLVQAPYTILVGLVIGYFVLYSGSLWPGIAIHFANNAISVIMEWVTLSTTTDQDKMISMLFFFGRLIIGVTALIFLRIRKGSLFYVPPSKYPLKEKDKYISFSITGANVLNVLITIYFFTLYMEPI